MICGSRGGDNDPIADWEEPDGQGHHRCRLHHYELVPQDAVRHDDHLAPDGPDPHQQAPAYRIITDA